MATFGDFPGVQVTTQSGGVTSVTVGTADTLVVFGEAEYNASLAVEGDDATLDVSEAEPEQINALSEADAKFGAGSELAEGMKEAAQNGASLDFLFGVAVPREQVTGETQSAQEGSLANVEIVEDTDKIVFDDGGTQLDVEFRYSGAPSVPTDSDTVHLNPLTGEYAADAAPGTDFSVDYQYNDFTTALQARPVRNIVNENETGLYAVLSDSDAVSSALDAEVSSLRTDYKLVNGVVPAEPNDQEILDPANTTATNGGADARFDPSTYSTANQSVTSESIYKFGPAREEGVSKTIAGGFGGLFAGNDITNPIYNDALSGFTDLEQVLSKTEADNLRAENVIPVRSGGTIRVQGNRSTAFGQSDTVAADFFTRRVTDRVILIGKQVGDATIGRINDQDTRNQAERLITSELRQLVQSRLIQPNTGDEVNFSVEVFESSTDRNKVNINISITPFGIVKRIDETVTVDTS
jgi:hypothetical protein